MASTKSSPKKTTKKKETKAKDIKLTEEQKQVLKARAEQLKIEIAKKKRIRDEVVSAVFIVLGLFLAAGFHFGIVTGAVGQVVSTFLFGLFGKAAHILPYFLMGYGVLNFLNKTSYITGRSLLFFFIFLLTCSGLFATLADKAVLYAYAFPEGTKFFAELGRFYAAGKTGGGILGTLIAYALYKLLGNTFLYVVLIVLILICLMFIMDTPISGFIDKAKIRIIAKKQARQAHIEELAQQADEYNSALSAEIQKREAERAMAERDKELAAQAKEAAPQETMPLPTLNMDVFSEEPAVQQESHTNYKPEDIGLTSVNKDNKQRIIDFAGDENLFSDNNAQKGYGLDGKSEPKPQAPNIKFEGSEAGSQAKLDIDVDEFAAKITPAKTVSAQYKFPPISLLHKVKSGKTLAGYGEREQGKLLEQVLDTYGVKASVVNVTKGPAVTRFEVQPALGVRVNTITRLHDDIMLNMRANSLRIEAPIPGKNAVGIEISNDKQNMVSIREILESDAFVNSKSKITMALGMSITGEPIVSDLKDMPHLLIGGSTGSGKSVCINSILMSILYKATPKEVRLILIDPKVVELSIYNGIPHLMVPVVSEPAKAAAALGWACAEMDKRYEMFSVEHVRNLEGYNETVIANGEEEKVMPQVVIVIDELADLMALAKNQVEGYIARLASKARAAGIHMILATQRPSVEVITGTIKNNMPSRIAFKVGSGIDARTIIPEGGAEHLLGKGDMLFAPQGSIQPMRVQGCFISDEEVNAVLEYIFKHSGVAEYSSDVSDAIETLSQESTKGKTAQKGEDELLPDVVAYAVDCGQISVSSIQRRFAVGYNRSARLVELMEERNIIGPAEGGNKARKVLLTKEELYNLQDNSVEASEGEIDVSVPEEIDF